MRKVFVTVLFLLFTISMGAAQSGVKIISTQKMIQMGGITMNQTIYVAPNQIRIDVESPRQNQQIIFDAGKNVFWVIDKGKGTYSEITDADLDKMAVAVNQAMARMKEQLKNMPPAQRKMMEDMMKKQGMDINLDATASAKLPTYKKVKSGVKINSFTADEYTAYKNNQKIMEGWYVPPAKVDLKKSDMAVFKKLGKFFGKISQGKSVMANFNDDNSPGYPVKQIVFTDGQPTMEMEVQKVERVNFGPEVFRLPPNLKKKSLFPGMGK